MPSSSLAPSTGPSPALAGWLSVPFPSAAMVRQGRSALSKEDLYLKDVLINRGPQLSFKFYVYVHIAEITSFGLILWALGATDVCRGFVETKPVI